MPRALRKYILAPILLTFNLSGCSNQAIEPPDGAEVIERLRAEDFSTVASMVHEPDRYTLEQSSEDRRGIALALRTLSNHMGRLESALPATAEFSRIGPGLVQLQYFEYNGNFVLRSIGIGLPTSMRDGRGILLRAAREIVKIQNPERSSDEIDRLAEQLVTYSQ
jgi:hypothetical protein